MRVRGETWSATAEGDVFAGERIRVEAVRGRRLLVCRAADRDRDASDGGGAI